MNRQRYALVATGTVLSLLAGLSCSQSAEYNAPAPPPPPPPTEAARTYDYAHSIRPGGSSKLTRKFVVALVRFGEDRPVEDVPYGIEPDRPTPTGDNSTNVDVDVQIGGNRPAVREKQPPSMNLRARDILKRELMESESFVLVERERILDLLREQKFGETRYVNPETNPEIGEVMGVQYLLEGSMGYNEDRTLKDTLLPPPSYKDGEPTLMQRIFHPGDAASKDRLRELSYLRRREFARRTMQAQNCVAVYLSLYDVRTSEIVTEAFGIGGNGLEAIRDAVEELIDKCRDIPNPVTVAGVDGERVFLDVGAQDPVKVGQRFRYLIPGPVIRNRAGQIIGNQDEEGGELEIIRVDPLMSVGKVTTRVADPVVGARLEPLD
jgi:hypothetical protein